MSTTHVKPNMAELAVLRGKGRPQDLEAWTKHFAKGDPNKAKRYLEAVRSFFAGPKGLPEKGAFESYLGGKSPHTRKYYSRYITNFFEWIAARKGRVVSPEDVTRADAGEYLHYLASERDSLSEEKLKDGDREEDRYVVDLIRSNGGTMSFPDILQEMLLKEKAKPAQIARMLSSDPLLVGADGGVSMRAGYRYRMGQLVKGGFLKARPSVQQLRQEEVIENGERKRPWSRLGISLWVKDGIPYDFLFSYSLVEPKQLKRVSIALEIDALSAFWKTLSYGDNTEGGAPLIQYNIWTEHRRSIGKHLKQERKASAAKKLMTQEQVVRLLSAPVAGITGLRDRAILFLLAFTGIRITELVTLKRGVPTKPAQTAGWFDPGPPPSIHVTRKGQRRDQIPYPEMALQHLQTFQQAIEARRPPPGSQSHNENAPGYLPPEDESWVYERLSRPTAPLFPCLAFWGSNAGYEGDVRHFSQGGVRRMLKGFAEDAGFTERELVGVHPHAFRHFFATSARKGGMPTYEIQERMGLGSAGTLDIYFDKPPEAAVSTAQAAILQGLGITQEPPRPAARTSVDGPPMPSTSPTESQVATIDTRGEPVVEPRPAPAVVLSVAEGGFVFHEGPAKAPTTQQAEPPAVPLVQPTATGAAETVAEHAREAEGKAREGVSLGSPWYSYEGLKREGTGEPIAFTRASSSGTGVNISLPPDKAQYQSNLFLRQHYDPWPRNYGVGERSLLPWFFQGGAPGKYGFYAGNPPLPVWSLTQIRPDTDAGERFLAKIEAMYWRFLVGDAETNRAPNPTQAYGLIRWYGFYVYSSQRLFTYLGKQDERRVDALLTWHPFGADIEQTSGKHVREHDQDWLLDWLEQNAHTYRTSMRAYRNVGREDSGNSWVKATLEGVDLVTKLPTWFTEDDPLAMPEDEWRKFVRWLSSITGRHFTSVRQEERIQGAALDVARAQKKRQQLEGVLLMFFEENSTFFESRKLREKSWGSEMVASMRSSLYMYLSLVADVTKLTPEESRVLHPRGTGEMAKLVQTFGEVAGRLGVPNPMDAQWKAYDKVPERVAAISNMVFPQVSEEDVLLDGSVVNDSELFANLELEMATRQVGVREDYRQTFLERFGQDPELLLRRALRGMWEAVKGNLGDPKDARERERAYNWLISYVAWVVPSGQEMERRALEGDVGRRMAAKFKLDPETMSDAQRRELRMAWFDEYQRMISEMSAGHFDRVESRLEEETEDPIAEERGMLEGREGVYEVPAPIKRRKLSANAPRVGRLSDARLAVLAYDLFLVSSIEGTTETSRRVDAQVTPNGKPGTRRRSGSMGTYVYTQNDGQDSRWHPALTPNGKRVYFSEQALEQTLNAFYVPQMLLPSPFRQVLATVLG